MEFKSVSHLDKRPKADVLVIPFAREKEKLISAAGPLLKKELKAPLSLSGFKAREGELLWVYADTIPEGRVALLGLGETSKINTERLRRAYASLGKACQSKALKQVNLCVPDIQGIGSEELFQGIAEGMLLPNYQFSGKKAPDKEGSLLIEKVGLIGATVKEAALAKRCAEICKGVYFARDLVNGNADDVTPQHLAQVAKQLAKEWPQIKTTVLEKKQLVKEKFGLLLAVNRGASSDPALMVLEYRGNPESKEHIVLVGKGITYDTGGLNLKPTGSMETMKADMAGAAAVLGALLSTVSLGLRCNVSVVIPSTENSIDAASYKPGDVYTGYSGKSVEIANTDAEGRLVLADALGYAVKKLRPTMLIDLATLTGAMDVALGSEVMGLFSNDDRLSGLLEEASARSFERVWRLPLVEEYREQLKSDIADMRNLGGKGAGSIKAALFLEAFVADIPWAHLDIAAVAYGLESKRYWPKHGTGIGVRLLVDFLAHL